MKINIKYEPTSAWILGDETKFRCLHDWAYEDYEVIFCDDCDSDFQTTNGISEENEIAVNLSIIRADSMEESYDY